MKTIDDLVNDITKLEETLKAELPKIVEVYGGDALAEVWQRIEREGAREGASYSTEPMYASQTIFNQKGAFKARGKAFTSAKRGKAKLKSGGEQRKSMYLPGGYEELRSIQGLPTNVVNLEYTGLLHKNMHVLEVVDKGNFTFQAIVGAVTQENKDKLAGLRKKYGDFLQITPEIASVINEYPIKRLKEVVNETLG